MKNNIHCMKKIYEMTALYHFIGEINQKQCKKCIFVGKFEYIEKLSGEMMNIVT